MMFKQQNKIFSRLLIIFSFILLLTACDSRPKGVLNETEMENVLTDLHKLDATLGEVGLMYNNDTIKSQYYNFVLTKHGVTKAEFDSSLVWYTKNPQKFEKVYDNVLIQLTDLDKSVKNGKYHFVDSVELAKVKDNIWNKRTLYKLTKDSARTRLDFEIKTPVLLYGDVYILKFLQRISHEDSCTKQHVVLRINYLNGKKDSALVAGHNDSLQRRYTIKLPALKKLRIKSISGELLGSKTYKGKLHATVDSISLIRKYNPKLQESLRKMIEKANPIKVIKVKADTTQSAQKATKMLPKKPK